MNFKMMIPLAGLVLAGCATCSNSCSNVKYEGVAGNWGLKLGYESMSAGHLIISQDASGNSKALLLWRWASPYEKKCSVNGNSFVIKFSDEHDFVGTVKGDKLAGYLVNQKTGEKDTDVVGWRNPPIEKASSKNAIFGESIDLLAGGLEGWKSMDEKAKFGWVIREENGEKMLSNILKKGEHGANLMSLRDDFYDFTLSYDVRVPENSNSGVYLRGRYEIQVFDSYGKSVDCHNMAAYYGRVTPLVAAEKKPGEWQHVDVTLYKRHLTVVLNGQTIIDNAPVTGVTGGAIDANEFVAGPIYLQGDHSNADFKNMILRKAVK